MLVQSIPFPLTGDNGGLLVGPELVVRLAGVLAEVALVHAGDAQHVAVAPVADHRRRVKQFAVLKLRSCVFKMYFTWN